MLPLSMNAIRTTAEDLLSGVLGWKLLKSHGGCCFLVLQGVRMSMVHLYLLNCPTHKGRKELSHRNVQ